MSSLHEIFTDQLGNRHRMLTPPPPLLYAQRRQVESFERVMKEPGEQCTGVFALIVTGPTSECVWGFAWFCFTPPPPHPPGRFRNSSKDDIALLSKFLNGKNKISPYFPNHNIKFMSSGALTPKCPPPISESAELTQWSLYSISFITLRK